MPFSFGSIPPCHWLLLISFTARHLTTQIRIKTCGHLICFPPGQHIGAWLGEGRSPGMPIGKRDVAIKCPFSETIRIQIRGTDRRLIALWRTDWMSK